VNAALLALIGSLILVLDVWMIAEGLLMLARGQQPSASAARFG